MKKDDKVNTYGDTHSNPTLAPSSNIFKHTKLKRSMQDSAMKARKYEGKGFMQKTLTQEESPRESSNPLQRTRPLQQNGEGLAHEEKNESEGR